MVLVTSPEYSRFKVSTACCAVASISLAVMLARGTHANDHQIAAALTFALEAAKRRGTCSLYMKLWETVELERCRQLMCPDDLTHADMMAQYQLWGGTPRYLFELLCPSLQTPPEPDNEELRVILTSSSALCSEITATSSALLCT
eukprot:15528-Heterococcus_DN1.PRE.7